MNSPKQPATDGKSIQSEKWAPRGIGQEYHLTCFVSGEQKPLMPNLSGFVSSKEAGERVVAMFGGRAKLDYRENEPHWIQVKVGALPRHKDKLERLMIAVQEAGNTITPELIETAKTPVSRAKKSKEKTDGTNRSR